MNKQNLAEKVKWTEWSPLEILSPEFSKSDGKLTISMSDKANLYGKFVSERIDVNSPMLIFEAAFSCENVKNEEKSIFAMLSFYDSEQTPLERDYVDIVTGSGGKKLYRKLDIPENAAYVMIEIGVRWAARAVVAFSEISLKEAESEPPRLVKIATTYQEQQDTPEENLQEMIRGIEQAGAANVDVILLSEFVYESYCGDPIKLAQPIPGPLTDKIGEYARKYQTYIIFSMSERDDGVIYNTAVIIGRDGKICGKYRKIHLPLAEAEMGITPGDEHLVFDLDFGRIGIIVCYDQYFPENSRTLALMGAEMIFNPTQGEDEVVQRAIARTNGVYVVVSGFHDESYSRIINPLGEVINRVESKEARYAASQIDLNERHFVSWMSIGEGKGELRSLFQKEREISTYDKIRKEAHKL